VPSQASKFSRARASRGGLIKSAHLTDIRGMNFVSQEAENKAIKVVASKSFWDNPQGAVTLSKEERENWLKFGIPQTGAN
jgi:hypothetical protein